MRVRDSKDIAQINVRVPRKFKTRIHEAAAADYRSVTDLVAMLLAEWLLRQQSKSKQNAA
jgi:hypothetical protein